MTKIWPILLIGLTFNTFAEDAKEETSTVNFLEATFEEFNYVKPEKRGLPSGKLIATDLALSRADLTVNVKNKNKVFDAGIVLNKDSIAFSTDVMDFDFKLAPDSSFYDVNLLNFQNLNTNIYPLNFQSSGDGLEVKFPEMRLKLKNFFMYCSKNDPSFDMATADGIEQGCMHEFSLTAKNTRELSNILLDIYREEKTFTLSTDVKSFDLQEANQITAVGKNFKITYDNFVVKTSDLYAVCGKSEDVTTFDYRKILKDCENTMSLRTDRVIISDTRNDTRFLLKPKFLKIDNERIEMQNGAIQFVDDRKAVTMYGFNMNCAKADEATAYDIHELIGECVKDGRLEIDNTVVKRTRSMIHQYRKVLSGKFDPLAEIDENDSEVTDLEIDFNDNKVELKLKQYKKLPIVGKIGRVKIKIFGTTTHFPEEGILKLKVDDVDVKFEKTNVEWLFQDAVQYVSKTLADVIVNSIVAFDGDRTFTFKL